MAALSCPLCCDEKFADTKGLSEHLSAIYKRLKCPLCLIRFDNLMVMIKHLERGCSGKAKELSMSTGVNMGEVGKETPPDNAEEYEDTEMIAASSADESGEEATAESAAGAAEKELVVSETISEEQYLDKNGQLYKRRVVKISNLWNDLEATKTEIEDEASNPIRLAGKYSTSTCPLCGKLIRGEYSLRLHLETAHGENTHPCCYCTRVFRSDPQLQRHVAERHSMPYSCVYCNKPFNNLLMAKKHVQCHKSSRKPAYTCELCHVTAHTNTEMKRHYREAHVSEPQERDAPTPIAPYKKGSLWYSWRGYTYHQTHTTRAGVQVLRCWVDGCWVEVRVPVIGAAMQQGEHTHKPFTWLKERNEMYNSLRRRCMTETTPIRIIYDEEAVRYPDGAKNLVFPEATMRSWQKRLIQKIDNPTLEITLEEKSIEWEGEKPEPEEGSDALNDEKVCEQVQEQQREATENGEV